MSDVGERELLAIIFTDAVDSTARTASDEDYSLRILLADLDYMRNEAAVRGGTVLKNTGDGLLISFKSGVDAVECAISIQRGFVNRSENSAFTHKIGVHIGDVIKKDGDIYGSGVNTASRLVAQCPAGGICISSTLYELVKQKSEIGNLKINVFQLKNIEPPIKAYSITDFQKTELSTELFQKTTLNKKTRTMFVSIFFVSLLGAVFIVPFLKIKHPQESKTIKKEILQTGVNKNKDEFEDNDEIIGDWIYQGGSSLVINSNGSVMQAWADGGVAGHISRTGEKKYIIYYDKTGNNTWTENVELSQDGFSFKGLNNFGEFVFAKRKGRKAQDGASEHMINLAGEWTAKGDTRDEESGASRYYVNQEQNTVILFSEEKPIKPRYAHVIVATITNQRLEGTLYDLPKGRSTNVCKIQGNIIKDDEIRLRVVDQKFEWSIVRVKESSQSPANPQQNP